MKRFYKIGDEMVKVELSDRKNKQLKATFKDGEVIHFGDKSMPEFPNTKRGDNYCARSSGIKSKERSANTLSRKILWKCKEKESMPSFSKAGVKVIKKEEYFDSL